MEVYSIEDTGGGSLPLRLNRLRRFRLPSLRGLRPRNAPAFFVIASEAKQSICPKASRHCSIPPTGQVTMKSVISKSLQAFKKVSAQTERTVPFLKGRYSFLIPPPILVEEPAAVIIIAILE